MNIDKSFSEYTIYVYTYVFIYIRKMNIAILHHSKSLISTGGVWQAGMSNPYLFSFVEDDLTT